MFVYDISDKLKKKLIKLSKKDKVLGLIFKRKLYEIIHQNSKTIQTYKNLKSPLNNFKRIHLNDNFILLFQVDLQNKHIIFVDILHWDKAYK